MLYRAKEVAAARAALNTPKKSVVMTRSQSASGSTTDDGQTTEHRLFDSIEHCYASEPFYCSDRFNLLRAFDETKESIVVKEVRKMVGLPHQLS